MDSTKYVGMDVHTEAISVAVRNSAGKLIMESILETKANTILEFIIRELFNDYGEAARESSDLNIFPIAIRRQIETSSTPESRIRLVSDFISGMSERQIVNLHHQRTGASLAPLLGPTPE